MSAGAAARSLSVVLAVQDTSSPELLSALERAVLDLRAAGVDELLVVEQRSPAHEGSRVEELLRSLVREDGRLRHLPVTSTRALIERGRLVNQAALAAKGELLWVHAPELVLPFDRAVPWLRSQRASLLKPFGRFVKLSARESERYLESGALEGSVSGGKAQLGEAMGKASYAIDRELFLASGGLHEALVGEADEGFELVRRLRALVQDEAVFEELSGLSLFTSTGDAERRQRRDNADLRARLGRHLERGLDAYLAEHLKTSLPADPAAFRAAAARRARAAALRITAFTPPPERPARLAGELWGVTTYFNPAGWRQRRENYDHFRAGLARDGLPLLAVEQALPGRPFELRQGDAERLIQLRSGDALWQKERLLNLALDHLPPACDRVVWLDADILFEERGWVAETAAALERYVFVQPFSLSVRLRPRELRCDAADLPLGNGEHEVLHSIAYGVMAKGPACLSSYLAHGHSGYAWAGRREVLARHGLYDANILGNGDLNIAHAMFGGPDYLRRSRLSEKAAAHLERWAGPFFADVGGSVAHVPGLVYHLWHGDHADRLYGVRLSVLIDNDFDPERDLTVDEQGLWRWATEKPALHAWCRDYFDRRREDPPG